MIVRKTTDEVAASTNAMLGLSGLDTAQMLKAMMKPYKTPISALSQKQQVVVWRQERYRELIMKLNDFKAKYFNNTNAATNITAAGAWNKMNVENPGSEYVKVSATGSSKSKNGTVELISMPTYSKYKGRENLIKDIENQPSSVNWANAAGTSLAVYMDSIRRTIDIPANFAALATNADREAALQGLLDTAFGAGNVVVAFDADSIPDKIKFTAASPDSSIRLESSTALSPLGFLGGGANTGNKVNMTSSLLALNSRLKTAFTFNTIPIPGSGGTRDVVDFNINGADFQFALSDSIGTVIEAVNRADCGVTMAYDSKTDSFSFTASLCGPGGISVSDTGPSSFLHAIGFGLIDEDPTPPATDINIVGGEIDPALVSIIDGSPANSYVFNVTVDGAERQISLGSVPYGSEPALIADINAQLLAQFTGAGLSIGVQPPVVPGARWRLVLNIDETQPKAARSVSFNVASSPLASGIAESLIGLAELGAKLPQYTSGKFGKVEIDGTLIQQDHRVFEYEGVLYDLKKLPPPGYGPISYTIRPDTDKIVELVRGFVDAYNDIVRSIGTALNEKRDYDYKPLTDEQKAEMSEKEIEKWEAKAKTGLLRGDIHFISLSSKLRMSVFNPVYEKYKGSETVEYSLYKMGIDTKDPTKMQFNWKDNGALYIHEDTLRYAIENDLDQVVKLFTKKPEAFVPDPHDPDEAGMTPAQIARMQRRYDDKTGGIATKFINIFDDYIRIYGVKGVLINRAGIENDMSDLDNALSREILDYNKRINSLWDRYDRIEKEKIRVLSRLEAIVQNSAAQMQWMQGQMGQK